MTANRKDGIALALVKNKGGVRKTTSAVSLGPNLAVSMAELLGGSPTKRTRGTK